jgi:hypothetical protein
MDNFLVPKSSKILFCKKCDYNTSRRSQWVRHLSTAKHQMDNMDNKKVPEHNMMSFECLCGKKYKYQSGLCKHKKYCITPENTNHNFITQTQDVIQTLIQENKDIKSLLLTQTNKLMEVAIQNKVITNHTTNNTTNNFNLQVFLNVTCKDAINISDFVDSLKVEIKDLEETGRLGYVDGISNIFINGLNNLDINKRPIHCSDLKRETFYIKDKDIWEKETVEKEKLKYVIRSIGSKNIKQIPNWQKENPDCFDFYSKKNDQYLKIVSNAMNGSTIEETKKNYDKIISKLAKEVVIQKET